MPQSRKKVPFSGKAKKEQLQNKKQRKIASRNLGKHKTLLLNEGSSEESNVQRLNFQPSRGSKSNPNRYVLQFHRETEEELQLRKEAARKSLVPASNEELEINIDRFFPDSLNFPIRPSWDASMNKQMLEAKENRYFMEYTKELEKNHDWSQLSYFELNLETWRQLWRVLEMSDIVLAIVDIRFPALMFPPSLYEYVTKTLGKDMILVLNKLDLAPAPLVVAWKNYLSEKFPKLNIIMFTSFPSYNLRGNTENAKGLKIRRRRGKLRMAAEGAQMLLDACKEIVKGNIDLSSWQEKINEEKTLEYDDEEVEIGETQELKQQDTSYEEHEKYKNDVLTVGCVGQPNVGKSSLMNALMGKKVVSVSRTPGHTKHFQTIFLTKNVRLCDCPGLVFPSMVPKQLQVVMGSFPIAQLREPYSSIQFLAERIDLVSLLKIKHPENDDTWSALDICEGWAIKKGFFTARAARPDVYRAANHLLRMALDGKITLCLAPPNYFKNKDMWTSHPEVSSVERVQAMNKGDEEASGWQEDVKEESSEEENSNPEDDEDNEEKEEESEEEDNEDDGDEDRSTTNKFQLLDISN